MSWDPIWEDVIGSREWGKYPPEELIRFVARHYYRVTDRSKIRFLELGCGPGANIWYLSGEGFGAYDIDAAPSALERARRRPKGDGLEADLRLGDVAELNRHMSSELFDAIIDVACLQNNRLAVVESILRQSFDCLKPTGRLFSMLLAAGTWGDGLGQSVEQGTYTSIAEGPLFGSGLTHFITAGDVERVFAPFTDLRIESSTRSFSEGRHIYKMWVIEAAKPS